MPELPEVETIRSDLSKFILNKKIVKINFLNKKSIKNNLTFFKNNLLNKKFVRIGRRGKLLYFFIKNDFYLLVHLKMTGQLIYCGNKNFAVGGHANSKEEEEKVFAGQNNDLCQPGKYTRIYFELEDGSYLFFNDLRLFGYLKIVNRGDLDIILSKFGIEPLQSNFKLADFKKVIKNRSTSIKAVILNQQLVAGVGNIYADESLFDSGIMPDRPGKSLNDNEIKKLFNAIKKIIKKAVKNRGTTFSDYLDSSGKRGNFSNKLKVYGRKGKKCLKCGSEIKKNKTAGRGTHFCTNCQK